MIFASMVNIAPAMARMGLQNRLQPISSAALVALAFGDACFVDTGTALGRENTLKLFR